MFASLGGEESWEPKIKKRDPSDEFGLSDLQEDEGFGLIETDSSGVSDILRRHPVALEELSQLEGEMKNEATIQIYRKNAIRENRLSNWMRDQCAPLLLEYQECFKTTKFKLPFISCAAEESAYHHCLEVAKVCLQTVFSLFRHPSTLGSILNPSFDVMLTFKLYSAVLEDGEATDEEPSLETGKSLAGARFHWSSPFLFPKTPIIGLE